MFFWNQYMIFDLNRLKYILCKLVCKCWKVLAYSYAKCSRFRPKTTNGNLNLIFTERKEKKAYVTVSFRWFRPIRQRSLWFFGRHTYITPNFNLLCLTTMFEACLLPSPYLFSNNKIYPCLVMICSWINNKALTNMATIKSIWTTNKIDPWLWFRTTNYTPATWCQKKERDTFRQAWP